MSCTRQQVQQSKGLFLLAQTPKEQRRIERSVSFCDNSVAQRGTEQKIRKPLVCSACIKYVGVC